MLQPNTLRGETRLTQRWKHGGLKGEYMRGIAGHIAVGCHRGDHPISWRIASKRFTSRTSRTTFTLIPEGHDGHWDIGGSVEVSHVYLTQRRLQACADVVAGGKRAEILVRVAFEDPTSASLLEILSREALQQSPSARLFVEQAIELLCTRLVLGHSSIDMLPAPASRPRGLADWQMKRVTSFMRDNLDRQIGLDDLANLVNLSRFHFCTAFRRATGHTPYQWLTAQRIGRARELLADLKLSITDIALAVGYETPSAFSASFRKVTGTSPSNFRRHI